MPGVAADPLVDLGLVRNPLPIVHAILALILLLFATASGVYKPLGMTAYGRRKRDEHRRELPVTGMPRSQAALAKPTTPRRVYLLAILAVGVNLALLILHFAGGGLGQH
jgi:hypothetical protein